MITEYDVTYITKEFLLINGWKIIAFNPPGSQGTFTIPNPSKDPKYKGQSGSQSPDIVVYKLLNNVNTFLIIESKPIYNEKDVKKMIEMFSNPTRFDLALSIFKIQARANGIDIKKNIPDKILFGKAHGGLRKHVHKNIITFLIKLKNKEWNPKGFHYGENVYSNFMIEEIH